MQNKHWENCLSLIKSKINIQSYITWFKPIKATQFKNKTLTLQVPNKFFYDCSEEQRLREDEAVFEFAFLMFEIRFEI